jgi:hypothetical protein
VIDPHDPTTHPPQLQGVLAGAGLPPPGPLDGGLDLTRYRVLRHAGGGQYRPIDGPAFVFRYDRDPFAWAFLHGYARQLRPHNARLADELLAELARVKPELDRRVAAGTAWWQPRGDDGAARA